MQLAHVQVKAKFRFQKMAYLRHKGKHPVLIRAHDIGIIYIAAIVFAVQLTFHVLVKNIQIDVTEQLAGQITDRQAASIISKEQTLAPVKSKPARP